MTTRRNVVRIRGHGHFTLALNALSITDVRLSGSVAVGICPIVSAFQSAVLGIDRQTDPHTGESTTFPQRVVAFLSLYIPSSQPYPYRIPTPAPTEYGFTVEGDSQPGTLPPRPSSINQPPATVGSTAITIVNYAQNKQRVSE